jgi:DNA-binding protein Fis
MKESMIYENAEVESVSSEKATGENGSPTGRPSTVMALKALASRLMREVESLNEVHTVDIHDGIDFYDEVTEFEIGLIRRALAYTHGHQGRAARLLNLKVTTLNSKIKQYKIKLDAFTNGYPVIDSGDFELRQHV